MLETVAADKCVDWCPRAVGCRARMYVAYCHPETTAESAVQSGVGRLTRQGHFGLVGMRERVELIGGQFGLESAAVRVTWRQEDQPASV